MHVRPVVHDSETNAAGRKHDDEPSVKLSWAVLRGHRTSRDKWLRKRGDYSHPAQRWLFELCHEIKAMQVPLQGG